MTEEEKIFAGKMFDPRSQELRDLKHRAHIACQRYNAMDEYDPARQQVLREILGAAGKTFYFQGPVQLNYGCHTFIGENFFANFNLTVQDDAEVTIGDDVNFGPGCSIVTPVHPMVASERNEMLDQNGEVKRLCYAKPVHIGNSCWFGANVTVCPGVTIGDGCVIGAGAVVTRDIPPNSFAAGVPAKVVRTITEADSMKYKPELLAGCQVIEE